MNGVTRKKKIVIIHYHPIEWYPPAMNIAQYLAKYGDGVELEIFCKEDVADSAQQPFKAAEGHVRVIRFPQSRSKQLPARMIGYLIFYFGCLLRLMRSGPDVILYYETISSWPALVYKKLRRNKLQLMAHYHEYVTPGDYKQGMKLVNYMHRLEQKMYETSFMWISQTNEVRLEKFLMDNRLQRKSDVHRVMPNYPSQDWLKNKEPRSRSGVTKLVYVGALGYDTMYFAEVLGWLKDKADQFSLDVYAYNIDQKVRNLLSDCQLSNLHFHGGCDYYRLPELLCNYDVGLILYKPFSENAIHVMPNKAFEYLACGLDVWFPEEMTYAWNFIREQQFPKMVPVNFSRLEDFDFDHALDRTGMRFTPTDYYYEQVYSEIIQRLL